MRLLVLIFGLCCFSLTACAVPSSKKLLVMNADDAGVAHPINSAIEKGLEEGYLSAASIIVVAPAFPEIATYAKAHPEYSWGVHLTLNSEWSSRWYPVLPRDEVPSLVYPDGTFPRTIEEVLQRANLDEVEKELRAQIHLAINSGIDIDHIDSHMGTLYEAPELGEILLKLALEYHLAVPVPRWTGLEHPGCFRRMENAARDAYPVLEKHGLPILDSWDINYPIAPEKKTAHLQKVIEQLPDGANLITVHPMLNFTAAEDFLEDKNVRLNDQEIIQSRWLRQALKKNKIRLVRWSELMNRAKAETH